jgi:transposase InsO family protein
MRSFNLPDRFKILAHHARRSLKSVLHPHAAEIEKRIAIISFFDNHGHKTTKEAYGVSRSTVYNWKRTLALSGARTACLAPVSTAPVNRRTRQIDQRIIGFITSYRAAHPRVGQETINPHLAAFCQNNALTPISTATIARVIAGLKRAGRICDNPKRSYLNVRSGKIRCPGPRKKNKKIRRNGYLPQTPGDLVQVDSVTVFTEGLKRYIVTAIDLRTRFAFACAYGNLSSLSAKDFMEKFRKAAPFEIKRVQTDNGQEFEKYFRDYAVQNNIVQFFNYPRSPKSNAHIERFNRTIQEQHVEWHLEELREPREFNLGLMEYLIWYNTEKPHQGIGYRTPMRCVLDDLALTPEKSNMLRYSTASGSPVSRVV